MSNCSLHYFVEDIAHVHHEKAEKKEAKRPLLAGIYIIWLLLKYSWVFEARHCH